MTNFTLTNIFLIKPQNQFQFFFLIVQHLRRHIHGMFFFLSAVFQLLKKKVEKTHEKQLFHSSHIYFRMEKIEFIDFYMNGRNFY